MRFVLIIGAAVILLGLGFLSGAYVGPAVLRSSASGAPAGNPIAFSPAPTATPAVPRTGAAAPGDLADILRENNNYLFLKQITTYADGLDAAGCAKAVDTAQAMTESPNRAQAVAVLAGRWVEIDPQAALATAQANLKTPLGAILVPDVFSSLAGANATEAWKAAQALPPGPKRDTALQAVVERLAQSDPANAMALAQQLPAGQKQNSAVLAAIMQVGQSDPEKALTLAMPGATTPSAFLASGPERTWAPPRRPHCNCPITSSARWRCRRS